MILSLCSGIGGLDLAAEAVTGQQVGWHSETDPHASKVLERWYSEDPDQWEARRKTLAEKWGNNGAGTPLAVAVKRAVS